MELALNYYLFVFARHSNDTVKVYLVLFDWAPHFPRYDDLFMAMLLEGVVRDT